MSYAIQPEKFEIFCNRCQHQIRPPKIFAGAYARPETGMDFGLAFTTPRPQTVNLACKHNGWFQKISIPIPRAASRNSKGEGGLRRLEFRGHGGVHWTGIPKAWGDFQESNFQFGVVKSLQEQLVKNDLSKDDDSCTRKHETRSTQ